MAKDEGFYVDDRRFVVTEIRSDTACQLRSVDGELFDIANTHKTEIMPRVFTRVALNSSLANVRIDIDAPSSVSLATDKNYWLQTKNESKRGTDISEEHGPFPVPTSAFEPDSLTKETSSNMIHALLRDDDLNFLKLGAVLSEVQNRKWFGSHSNFQEYVEREHQLKYRKATYLTKIHARLKDADIPWNKIRDIGWTKLSMIVDVITPENVDEWVAAARSSTGVQLKELVKSGPGVSRGSDLSTMSFRVREGQRIGIRAALDLAKAIEDRSDDGEVLATICEFYLGKADRTGANSREAPVKNKIKDLAILAPVPLMHLESGAQVALNEGYVAFESAKWELFRKLDELRDGRRVPALIYPSHESEPGKSSFLVSWFGWYTGHVESRHGAHPLGMKHRPPTTASHVSDNQGHWAVFWHVEGLRLLPEEVHLPISEIQTVEGGWRKNAPPRGPELVSIPPSLGRLE